MHTKVIDAADEAIEHATANAATWLDPETGLEWQGESPGRMTWFAAQSYAQFLSIDGKNDWRLPTASELETLPWRSYWLLVIRYQKFLLI